MNIQLVAKYLGILSLLIGAAMMFSLFWSSPQVGIHTDPDPTITMKQWEYGGMIGLLLSMVVCFIIGGGLFAYGRPARAKLFRKEAMAVVGLSWVLATVLGGLPYLLSGTHRGPSIRTYPQAHTVLISTPTYQFWQSWKPVKVSPDEFTVLDLVCDSNARGLTRTELAVGTGNPQAGQIFQGLKTRDDLGHWLLGPGDIPEAPADRASHYRLAWVKMGLIDSMFESQSGFSTTGATVLCDLEDPWLVPHCILFWRASTHYLGGVGDHRAFCRGTRSRLCR